MKYDVFISYSRKDTEIANRICEALSRSKISFFIDRQGINGGMEFPMVLSNAICESKIFLFLASRNSYESKFTNNEITFAFNEKPKESILPYIIDGSTLPIHIRFIFAGINWRNIIEHPIETVLMHDLRSLINRQTNSGSCSEKNQISDILGNLLSIKSRFKASIQIKAYKELKYKGIAVVGKVCFGHLRSDSNYVAISSNMQTIQCHDILFYNISESIYGKSESLVKSLREHGNYSSDYECFLNVCGLSENNWGTFAKSGDIVYLLFTRISLEQLNNCTHIFRL